MKKRAYLDIETTGLSRHTCDLTVIGIAFETGSDLKTRQLIGDCITADALTQVLEGLDEIYTYNGSRFDLPFIKAKLNVDVKKLTAHTDLMYACWKHDLKGGLKAVERKLGIRRQLKDIDGFMAVILWFRYINNNDKDALNTLLIYNAEDVINLKTLRLKLQVD